MGSFFFIGEMIIDVEFNYDQPVTDHCGSCTRCIDACPTNAIYEPYRVDATKCISYLNIELKDEIPKEQRSGIGEWLFGCDICQDVCPWNRDAQYGSMEDLNPREKLLDKDIDFWEELDIQQYNELFEGTPVRRAKFNKFKDTVDAVAKNSRQINVVVDS